MKLPLLKMLCLAIVAVHASSAFALVALEDDALSETTGEGIALLPENFAVSMNGADATNGGAGAYGAGYMRFIPVGPLTASAIAKNYLKAEAWLYGVSLAQSKTNYNTTITSADWGVPFGAIGSAPTDFGRGITTWGTAENPWLIKATTDLAPNFVGVNQNVTHLDLTAPLYRNGVVSGSPESSGYNLKLGYWMDLAQRDAAVPESGYAGLSNRLRLAFVWDGFGIHGSNIKVFQTADGVTAGMGGTYTALLKINGVPNQPRTFNYGMSTSYNETFGMAGLLRLNSGTTDTRRGTVSAQTVTRAIHQVQYIHGYTAGTKTRSFVEVAAPMVSKTGTFTTPAEITSVENTNDATEIDETYSPMSNGTLDPYVAFYTGSFSNTGICTSGGKNNTSGSTSDNFGQCFNSQGFTTRRFKASGTNTWTPPTERSVMRLSTQELSTGPFGGGTPALGDIVPNFAPNTPTAEGVFLYDMNVNLVLGNLYQPIMLSTDGNNFSFEMARIPNNQNVYKKIYTRYEAIDPAATVDVGVVYEGSTCNIHQCGSAVTYGLINYQGSSATHSSISIGSTVYNATTNQLGAYKGIEAYGVSIGELKAGNSLASQTAVDYTQVWNRTRTWGPVQTSPSGCGFFGGSPCFTDMFRPWGSWTSVLPKTPVTGQPHPSLNRPDPNETTFTQNYNNQILGIQTTMPLAANMASTLNAMSPIGATVFNNFGSVAIDGLLIQHLKFSTTGL